MHFFVSTCYAPKRREKRPSLLNKIMSYIWSRFWQRHPFSTFWCHGDDDTAAATSLLLKCTRLSKLIYICSFVHSISHHITYFYVFFSETKELNLVQNVLFHRSIRTTIVSHRSILIEWVNTKYPIIFYIQSQISL